MKHNPIGIFDSGIGGLTVAHEVVKLLPKENIIYFGDTAHMPYGDKSIAAIQSYAIKIVSLLLEQRCKIILIACNSASAAAYEIVKTYVGDRAIVLNVIDPLIKQLAKSFAHKKLGLIGTKPTVHSHIYKKKVDALGANIELNSYATNLLASAIEEFGDHDLIDQLLKIYLNHESLKNIDGLILACTHYPIIKHKIAAYYEHKIAIIDAAEISAKEINHILMSQDLLNDQAMSKKHFYVSDYTETFAQNAKKFLPRCNHFRILSLVGLT